MIFLRPPALCLLVSVLFVSCGPSPRLKREAVAIAGRATAPSGGVKRQQVQQVCWELSRQKLRYQFGSMRPENGGLDCSGTVHHVLSRVGYRNVPRQSNHQYYWVKQYGSMNHESGLTESVLRRLKPGDMLFWRGTYRTGKRWPNISHVMFYSGRDPKTGNHYMFGGRSGGRRGLNGAEIDFFVLRPGESEGRSGRFVGYGRPPGLR
jgi:hypothetical protein